MFDWREFALCRDADPELWFPAGKPGAPAYEKTAARARDICAACPVRRECLAFGETEPDGIWGGLDPAQRGALRRAAA